MSYSPPPTSSAPAPLAPPRLRWLERVVLVGAGGLLVALLLVAGRLTPSARGIGTHQQLGLPPCTLLSLFGVRCPSCGMTTAWAHVMRGQALAAFRTNAGGAMLAVTAAVCGPWLMVSGIRGRWLVGPPHELATLAVGLAIVAVTIIDWTVRLSLGW